MQTTDVSGKPEAAFRSIGLLASVLLLLLIAAVAAAPAGAATAPEMGTVTPSYGSVHVTGTVHSESFFTPWVFEYSTDDVKWTEGPSGFIFSPLTVPVERDITGLKGGTKYFIRLVSNGVPSPGPDPEVTTLMVDPPAVLAVNNASEVEYTTAKLSGEVSRPANPDPAFDANCNFEYVADEQFGSTGFEGATKVGCGPENPVHTAGASQVSAAASGLNPGTKYHLRLSVSNPGGGDSKVAAGTFTTLGPLAPPSVISIANAGEVEYTSAKVSGEVNRPAGTDPALDTTCNFEYVTDEQFALTEFEAAAQVGCTPENPIKAPGNMAVSAELGGLALATKYHLRLRVSNPGGSDAKAAAAFTTLGPVPPPSVISVNAAKDVGYSLATLSGEVERPVGTDPILDANCLFEFIPDALYGNRNEVDKLVISATGGTFVLLFEGQESAPIAFNATPAAVRTALEGFAGIGPGNVTVSGGPGNEKGTLPYVITFGGALANTNIAEVGQNGSNLTGPAIAASLETTTQGHPEGFEGANQVGCGPENPVHKSGAQKVETVAGMAPATEYHLRLLVSNVGGTDVKVAPNFTTNGPQPAPVVSIDPVTVFTDTTAHFTGHVTPGGTEPSFAGEWYFRCTPECGINPGQFRYLEMDGKEFPVAMDVTGLEPNTDYQVVLHSFNFGGKEVETAPVSFKTSLAVPAVQTRSATEVKTTSAVLNGKVNPHNSAVTYQFEWGLDKTYGSSAPAPPASLGKEDNFFHVLEQPIAGLQEGTVYHFRLSAKNASSGVTAHGEDHTFRTSPAAACPNEQIRAEVSSLALPECRAYEMVTPIEKSANDAGFPGSNNDAGYSYAAADGNAVMFHTRGAMGHAESGLQIFALSRREADGWSTGGAVPLGTQTNINALTYYPKALIFSPNLDRVVWSATASWLLEIPVSTFGTSAVYRAENNGLNQVEWLTRPQIAEPQPPIGSQTYTPISFGASPDLETVYFWGDQTLMPGDNVRASNGGWGLYEYSGDELKHADTLPGGGLPPGGSAPANANGGRNPESWTSEINRGQVSADGKTLYFITPDPAASGQGPPELYVRRNGESTLVSRNEAGEAAPSGATDSVPPFSHSGQFVFGSPDGTSAIFQSEDALTADAPKDSTVKAYQYDVKANTIKYLPGLGGATVVASSDDGQRFLFEGRGLGVWDHGTIKSISNLGGELTPARATADGSDFVFRARVIPGFNSGFSWQVYRYDLAEEQLSCLSCPPDGVAVSTDATLGPEGDGISANYMISPDAGRVFFDSPDPLIPQDKNSVGDVYEWTPGGLSLISTGQTKVRSLLVASSASGNDVFFSTKQTLDPDDTDGLYDIYDARVDGGFKQKPHVSPCSGVDLCHGAPQEAAKPSGGGSDQFVIPPTPKFTAFPGKVVRGKLMVKVKAPVAATVSASGKGLRSTRHTNAKPGTFKLAIPLKPTAIRALREKHHLGLTVHLRYSPETGTPTTADLTLNVGREG